MTKMMMRVRVKLSPSFPTLQTHAGILLDLDAGEQYP
jgi:hypothetical protein